MFLKSTKLKLVLIFNNRTCGIFFINNKKPVDVKFESKTRTLLRQNPLSLYLLETFLSFQDNFMKVKQSFTLLFLDIDRVYLPSTVLFCYKSSFFKLCQQNGKTFSSFRFFIFITT